MTVTRDLPDATELSNGQYRGWNCVWCDTRLLRDAVPAGRATGHLGVHDMSTDVYACPDCATTQTTRPRKART
jgi:hypothetical protein